MNNETNPSPAPLHGLVGQLRELHQKATPAPWAVHPVMAQIDGMGASRPKPVCRMLWPTNLSTEGETLANAQLQVAMRNALPVLLEIVEAAAAYADAGWVVLPGGFGEPEGARLHAALALLPNATDQRAVPGSDAAT